MPGNRRRSSTAAENSPPWLNAARIAAASASVTTNIIRAWEHRSGSASCFRAGERPTTRWSSNFRCYMKAGRSAGYCARQCYPAPLGFEASAAVRKGNERPSDKACPASSERVPARAAAAADPCARPTSCDLRLCSRPRVGLRRPAVRPYERPRGACSSPCDAVVDRESVAADLFQSQAQAGPATATISTAIATKRLIFASSDFP